MKGILIGVLFWVKLYFESFSVPCVSRADVLVSGVVIFAADITYTSFNIRDFLLKDSEIKGKWYLSTPQKQPAAKVASSVIPEVETKGVLKGGKGVLINSRTVFKAAWNILLNVFVGTGIYY